jgi:hypothetical protein
VRSRANNLPARWLSDLHLLDHSSSRSDPKHLTVALHCLFHGAICNPLSQNHMRILASLHFDEKLFTFDGGAPIAQDIKTRGLGLDYSIS